MSQFAVISFSNSYMKERWCHRSYFECAKVTSATENGAVTGSQRADHPSVTV